MIDSVALSLHSRRLVAVQVCRRLVLEVIAGGMALDAMGDVAGDIERDIAADVLDGLLG
ncbi:hypothetical protein [Actinomadura verrucosospora]|uniref:hypothetical protein n=1 Tax=Actinomadura verrucosospora TaxID=46165 RepID=UPI00156609EB|nr:hypothetical protein [Actinomadura verrucosospora]